MAVYNYMDPQVKGFGNLFLSPDRFFVCPLGERLPVPQSCLEAVKIEKDS